MQGKLRALVIATLGIPVSAALLSGAVTLVVYSALALPGGVEPEDLWGALFFGVPALLVVLLSLSVARKRGPSVAPWLVKVVPGLLALGAAGGVVFVVGLFPLEHLEAKRKAACTLYLGEGASAETLVRCMGQVKHCFRAADRAGSKTLAERAIQACLDERLR